MTPLAQIIRDGINAQVASGDASMITETAIDVCGPIDLDDLAEFIDKELAANIDEALKW